MGRYHVPAEANAIRHFSTAAASGAAEKEGKGFYHYLADWEKQHFDALQNLYTSVRQDFFSAGSFAPF